MTDQPRNPALGLPLHEFPYPWVEDFGVDEFGVWMICGYGHLNYVFRWIVPGTFLMGSPESEPSRSRDEIQHSVRLTNGFWLGETTVSQALWDSMMGFNPSHLKGDEKPVDQVSWEDVQPFLAACQPFHPGFSLRLPTEAEWEYACRAGTITPFSFGNQIHFHYVNFDGTAPYNGGARGERRMGSVDVYAFPSNAWGLYQMHGNVWEWCQDWRGEYPIGHAIDPKGPDKGEYRIIRGGSHGDCGAWCRSAYRLNRRSTRRYPYVGFRMAANHPDLINLKQR